MDRAPAAAAAILIGATVMSTPHLRVRATPADEWERIKSEEKAQREHAEADRLRRAQPVIDAAQERREKRLAKRRAIEARNSNQ